MNGKQPTRTALNALKIMVDTAEKLYTLPSNEVLQNTGMLEEMKNAISAHNIDNIINGAMTEFTENKSIQAASTEALLRAYANRENARVKNVQAVPFITEIVNTSKLTVEGKPIADNLPAKTRGKAESNFSSVFNSVYSNGAVKINTPSDPSTLMSYIDYSPYRVNYAEYLSVPTLSEMVDRPIAMALKKFPKVKCTNEQLQPTLDKVFQETKIKSVMRDALFYSMLSPRGALVVPIQRGEYTSFNVFNDTQFAYGMGTSYSGISAPYSSTRVGDLYCLGAKLRHGVSAFFLCPGYEPLYGVGLNRVPQLRAAAEAWNLYVHILKILLVRAQVVIERMDGDIQTDTLLEGMRSQLQRLNQTMGISTPIAQARGATLDILNNNISPGTSEIAGVFRDFVASVTGLAPEYFFGGGNTNYSQAAFQIASTNENIRARYQIGQIEPVLRFIINTLIRNDKRVMSLGITPDDFEIEFESIYDETEQEKADLAAKRTETLIRQRDYPELEKAFKQLDLLADDISLDFPTPHVESDGDDDNKIKDDGKDTMLTKPLL